MKDHELQNLETKDFLSYLNEKTKSFNYDKVRKPVATLNHEPATAEPLTSGAQTTRRNLNKFSFRSPLNTDKAQNSAKQGDNRVNKEFYYVNVSGISNYEYIMRKKKNSSPNTDSKLKNIDIPEKDVTDFDPQISETVADPTIQIINDDTASIKAE